MPFIQAGDAHGHTLSAEAHTAFQVGFAAHVECPGLGKTGFQLGDHGGIDTGTDDGELMLSILASYAQEESLSTSENQKWRVRQNFENGQPWRGFMLGYRYKDGQYIDPMTLNKLFFA